MIKPTLFGLLGLAALSLSACNTTQERVGGAGVGAVAGAAVAGPVGAVAGGVLGAATGPSVSRSVGVPQRRYHRRYYGPRRSVRYHRAVRHHRRVHRM